ncbi:hypothetical protein JK358_34285 [Nocardia sp. 2]|uniref:Uncharacterized protein n=1 Tax=Nocardia acididurans TaxID=2802282 RepID=A0ABS1MFU6_9NOCA|nr:hypothetical protein [Nocardia acididurans]MBL1079487.1 hypothetical protein [Nocardia acididurans]
MSYRLGIRDMTSATVVAEHYGAPLDQVATILDTSIPNTRRIVARWRNAGLMADTPVKPIPGMTWVYCTAKSAEELQGFPCRYWKPTPTMADHVLTVLRVRLALVGPTVGNWVSERRIRYDSQAGQSFRGVRRPHIHDGRYTADDGSFWAVEVELTAKDPVKAREAVHGAYEAARLAGCDGLVYYCRGEAVRTVVETAARGLQLSTDCKFVVADLDAMLEAAEKQAAEQAAERAAARAAAKAGTPARGGLRVITGGPESGQAVNR